MEEGRKFIDTLCGVSIAKNFEQTWYSVQFCQQIQKLFLIYLPLR